MTLLRIIECWLIINLLFVAKLLFYNCRGPHDLDA